MMGPEQRSSTAFQLRGDAADVVGAGEYQAVNCNMPTRMGGKVISDGAGAGDVAGFAAGTR